MKELSVRQSICSSQANSPVRIPSVRLRIISLLTVSILLPAGSFVFGQQPAPANQPKNDQAAKKQLNQNEALVKLKELMTPEEAVKFRKNKLPEFDKKLRAGTISTESDKKLIAEGARYQLYLMTLKQDPFRADTPTDLTKLRTNILRDIQFSGRVSGKYQARELYLKELTKYAEDLFDNQRMVRFNAVVLLSQLNLRDEDRRKKTTQTAYLPAYVPLLKIIASKEQPTELKIMAANGIARIGKLGAPPNALRIKIAEALIAALDNSLEDESWYQRSLVYALGSLNITDNLARRPIVVDTLIKVMNNPKRTFDVRSTAAYTIGTLPLKANSDIKLITYSIVDLTSKMVAAYNQNTKSRIWKRFFWNVYLAFKPESSDPNFAGKDFGLTKKPVNKTIVNDAYQQIIKPVAIILQPNPTPPIPAAITNSMTDWLKKNLPKNFRIAPVQAKPKNQKIAEGN